MEINIKDFLAGKKEELLIDDIFGMKKIAIGSEMYEFFSYPSVKGRIYKESSSIMAEFNLDIQLKENCSRCLKELSNTYNCNIDGRLIDADQVTEDDDAIYLSDSGTLDLNQILEMALLECVPFSSLCDEECKGMCEICGNNLNQNQCQCESTNTKIDSRFENLRNILNNK